jgi:hypothetical protein
MEIKMGAHRIDEGARTLKRLSEKVHARGAPSPAFLGVITSGGPCHQREDGIYVVPIDCLKP